ncbi:MAG: MFS transporter [Candidatus Heimdallarchaeum aukensis]|uniref:MFS transporter n=1 Tax=Candidatus Heimdallarchaeum aukensis TaxID=2876573 RepID=A0A9Y1FKJ5_9ARCH|nr:MAG: MFS transporter [Candidatus Heimdallarchaeum aukensis]
MRNKHFVSLSIFQIMAMFRRGIFYFFLSIYLKENLGVSNTEMTLYATLPMVANILTQSAVWGRISDKFQKRRLLIIFGELYAAVGYIVVYFIHKNMAINKSLHAAAYTIIIGFTIIEAGWSSSNLGWTALIADLTKETERGKIMGRLQFIGGIGNILGVTASGFLYLGGEGFSNGNLFFISSGIMVFSIIALFLIPESYAELEDSGVVPINNAILNKNEEGMENKGKNNTVENPQKIRWEWQLFVWILVVLGIVNIGGNSINQMVSIYIRLPSTFAASDVIVAQLRNTSSIAIIIGGLLVGFLTKHFSDHTLLLVGFSFLFIGTLILPFAPSIVLIFVYMALLGLSRVWIQTISYSMITKIIPLEIRGKMMGYYNAAFYLSWGLGGTLITGPVADSIVDVNLVTLSIYVGFFIVSVCMWLATFFISYFKLNKTKGIQMSSFSISFVFSVIVAFLFSQKIANWISSGGNSDAYSYRVTFYIAALMIVIGMLTYMLLRPEKFELFKTKNKEKTKHKK